MYRESRFFNSNQLYFYTTNICYVHKYNWIVQSLFLLNQYFFIEYNYRVYNNIYIPLLSSVQNKCGSLCMNRTTFRDLPSHGISFSFCAN